MYENKCHIVYQLKDQYGLFKGEIADHTRSVWSFGPHGFGPWLFS
jgi:hypothetical protein